MLLQLLIKSFFKWYRFYLANYLWQQKMCTAFHGNSHKNCMDHIITTKKIHSFINITYVLWKGVGFSRRWLVKLFHETARFHFRISEYLVVCVPECLISPAGTGTLRDFSVLKLSDWFLPSCHCISNIAMSVERKGVVQCRLYVIIQMDRENTGEASSNWCCEEGGPLY